MKSHKKLFTIIKVVLIALLVISVLIFIVVRVISKNSYQRVDKPQYTYNYYYEHYSDRYPRKEVKINTDREELTAFIYGEENTKALLVFSHGSGGFHEDYMKDITWFVDHGYRVFAADYTASGHSEGTYTGGLSRTPIDLDQVLTFIENDEELSKMDKVLYGHSWGAYGVTAVLNYEHDIKAVVSLAAYNAPAQQITNILSRTLSPVLKITEPFFWLNNVIDYGKYGNLTAVDGINKSNIPVLIVQGTGDQMISYEESSLVAFKDKITNPNVEYLIISEDGLNDHDSFFYTREGNTIIKAFNEKKGQLLQQYNGKIPDEELKKLYDEVDKEELNKPNEEFLKRMELFIEKSIH
ncbi:Dipeptidyl aminopeptidase/acylaminoacyl-peptidase-like protein [Lachnospiraceae bacterium TWA4]|nr:Dipeptidyl aminopeptidase/acylaminoacyl-peptidase-like protein [Lachnospiraceae bacterium TWA4]